MSECFDGRNNKSVKTSGDLRDFRDLQFEEICWKWNCCCFTWQAFFEESSESYLSLSRGAVWGYFGYRFDYGVSGVCTRYMRRYGSIWLVCSLCMLDELTAGRRACMS